MLGIRKISNIGVNILALNILKGLGLVVSFFYIPLLLNGMSPTNYGIWLTLTSIVSWIAMFDIGLGHGLRNKLAESMSTGDSILGRVYVSTAYGCIALLTLFLSIIFFVVNAFISWDTVLNVQNVETKYAVNILVPISFVAFFVTFLLHLIQSVLYALQLPALSSAITFCGQFVSFVIVFILVKTFDITSLLVLGSVVSLVPPVIMLLATIVFFSTKKYSCIAPSFRFFDKAKVRDILGLGVQFFIMQLSLIFIYQSNNLILSNTLGNDSVALYNISYKYIYMIYTFFSMTVLPFWSSTTQAYTRGDFEWIKMSLCKLKRLYICACVLLVGMVLLAPFIFDIWLGSTAMCSHSLNVFMAIAVSVQMLYALYGNIVNGIGKVRVLTIMHIVCALGYVPLAIGLARTCGVVGICIASTMINCCLLAVSMMQYRKIVNRQATGVWNR